VKLGLGTAQFGLKYGVSNRVGQTSETEVARIVALAAEQGIHVIDTAALYGSSEEVLGRVLPRPHGFRIVTKTVRIDAERIMPADADRIEEVFRASLERLGCEAVHGLLVHNADDLLVDGGNLIMDRLRDLRSCGLVEKVGVSVYGVNQVDALLERFDFDLIQAPVNVLDQRLFVSGRLGELKRRGIEVHARSAFLQGLLLMPPDEIPSYFAPIRQQLVAYRSYIEGLGITPKQAALGFLEARDDIDVIVCGVNTRQHLLELCTAAQPLCGIDLSRFALEDDAMLNPSRWRIT
jgi:aryl-alcohol dehydrogenase-like predicted oxidoreductase